MPAPRIVVDRIEGAVAVLEVAGHPVELPASALPEGAREGSVLALSLAPDQPDLDAAAARLERMQAQSGISDDFTF